MTEQERYQKVDMPFYHAEVAPALPPEVLDFHTHICTSACWKKAPSGGEDPGAKYMVFERDYHCEALIADGEKLFPDRPFRAVCFGFPGPGEDPELMNDYAAQAGRREGMFPLMLAGRDMAPAERIEQRLLRDGFLGYKVAINWLGNDYGDVRVEDMIGPAEMQLADKYRLVVLLHVPRSDRLADPQVQAGVRSLSRNYPNAQIVLTHCGRCYLPDRMANAIDSIKDLDNVYLDTAMVMEPLALQMVFEKVDSSRVLFATDLPIAIMRGRRVYLMDHWVDLVLEGFPPSAYRVVSSNMHATYMVYEIVLAIRRAAERAGLTEQQTRAIFFENGMKVLEKVRVKRKK